MNQKLGWIPDTPSFKDHKYAAPLVGLPARIDLRATPFYPPVMDQGATNSCVGNSTASAVRFLRRKLGLDDFQPSRMFIYYFARSVAHHGWEKVDEGAMIRDAMTVLTVDGVCREEEWTFDPAHVNQRPEQVDVHNALAHRTMRYVRMLRGANPEQNDLYYLRHSLADGFPFVFGISVYTSFFSAGDDGVVPMPKSNEKLEGGHAMYCVGYDDTRRVFICPNSWGEGWGDRGVNYLPYDYFASDELSDDFWTIRTMKEMSA